MSSESERERMPDEGRDFGVPAVPFVSLPITDRSRLHVVDHVGSNDPVPIVGAESPCQLRLRRYGRQAKNKPSADHPLISLPQICIA
jgi:hypothetical protein